MPQRRTNLVWHGVHDAVYEHTSTTTAFYKSRLAWKDGGWELTLRDGTVYVFGDYAPLQSIRDRFGNVVTIEHANGTQGNVTGVASPNGIGAGLAVQGSGCSVQGSGSGFRLQNARFEF